MLEENRDIYLETDFEFYTAFLSRDFPESIIYQVSDQNNLFYLYSPELASVDFSLDHLLYVDKNGWVRSSSRNLGDLYKFGGFLEAMEILNYCNNYEQFYSSEYQEIIDYYKLVDNLPDAVISACVLYLFMFAEPID